MDLEPDLSNVLSVLGKDNKNEQGPIFFSFGKLQEFYKVFSF